MVVKRDYLFFCLLSAGIGLVLYLSWRSNPQMSEVWFIPRWLAAWADENRNGTIRTAIPFLLLGILTGGRLAWPSRSWLNWLLIWGLLTGIAVLAETGQLLLSNRRFDINDIGWGAIGAAGGLGITATVQRLIRIIKLARTATSIEITRRK